MATFTYSEPGCGRSENSKLYLAVILRSLLDPQNRHDAVSSHRQCNHLLTILTAWMTNPSKDSTSEKGPQLPSIDKYLQEDDRYRSFLVKGQSLPSRSDKSCQEMTSWCERWERVGDNGTTGTGMGMGDP